MKPATRSRPETKGFRGQTRAPRNVDERHYEVQNLVTCAYWATYVVDQGLIEDDDAASAVQAAAGALERAVFLLQDGDWQ